MRRQLKEEFIKTVLPEELPEIQRLATLIKTATQETIAHAEPMPGGLTNRNFKVTLSDGRHIACRIAGAGTADYLNRAAEKKNAMLMASLGISPEIYYFDTRNGSELVEFVEGKTLHPEDFQTDREVLAKAAQTMKTYHQSGFKLAGSFNPMHEIRTYARILSDNKYDHGYEDFDDVRDKFFDLRDIYVEYPPKKAPCHNDPLSENWIYDGERLTLIDWEYGGMNDPFFDLAALCVENDLDQEAETYFLQQYFDGPLTEEQEARVYLNKFLMDLMWGAWAPVQIVAGKDHDFYKNYGLVRINRCREYIKHPKFDRYLELIKVK